ncbi:MAG: hypothetical protein WC451_03355 [Patescibacteria group bacterium]|jgi:hypothetical protein
MNTETDTIGKIVLTQKEKGFSAVEFAIKAISKDASRYAINLLYVKDDQAVGTDGRRLHIGILPEDQQVFSEGLYEILSCQKKQIILLKSNEEGLKFPGLKDIFPRHTSYFYADAGSDYFVSTVLGNLGKDDIYLNYRFLESIAVCCDKFEVWYGKSDRPVFFRSGNYQAIIMPIKIEARAFYEITPKGYAVRVPEVGAKVKILPSCDETADKRFVGSLGTVKEHITTGNTGETPENPLLQIAFDTGDTEQYWSEEVEVQNNETS